ncbi:MAG: DUF6434 domain-containing protein [Gordonia sp. (in: high G+C Gram-positive bacteria)]|uniref:DUF6434 domain-containing protein n=1 Tax=Gordonia sp. (in: high G+C Gram-positive bacteria) TaxID=84139 RepID=UPI0039E645FB
MFRAILHLIGTGVGVVGEIYRAPMEPSSMSERPELTRHLSGNEFRQWYWLRSELADFARSAGIGASGGKQLLTDRIAALLDGSDFTEPPRTAGPRPGAALAGDLASETVIPSGQRCSQVLRAWFTERIGPGFRYDAPMRDFIASADGRRTLQDAVDHWYATRDDGRREIDPQFEYNRFTRWWRAEHPDDDRAQLLAAWQRYRDRPVDERGRI